MPGEVDRLSGKLGLDTTDFKTAIAAANRELRVLESGFKASAAALTDWTKDATGLESRVKSLTSQIDIQKAKVAALAAEHQRLVEENGENSRAAQDAEIKLNKETETLNKMQVELGDTQSALQEMKEGEADVGKAAEEMGDDVEESKEKVHSLEDAIFTMGSAAGIAIGAVAALGAAAIAAVGAVGALVLNAASSASDLVDMSNQTGISTERLQELGFIGDQVGTSLDTITGAQARLIRSAFDATEQQKDFNKALAEGKDPEDIKLGELAQAFNDLGVSTTDSAGNLRDSEAIFADTIDALGRVENPTLRDALAMQIFGKSAQELNPLITAGSDEMARLAKEAHDMGAVMSEEDVAALESFDDSMAAIQSGIKGMLGALAAEFLPIFQDVTQAIQDLFKSDEFKAGVEEFTKIIRGVVEVTAGVLKQLLSGDIRGALSTLFGADRAGQLISLFETVRSFIQDTLIPFVTDHAQEIKAALIGIGAAFAAAGIVTAIAGIVAAINPVSLTIAAIVAAVGVLAAAWTGNWGGIRDTVQSIWDGYLKPALSELWNFLSTTIPAALQTLSNFWTGTLLPAIQTVWGFLSNDLFPLFSAIADFMGAVLGLAVRVLAGLWQNVLLPALSDIWSFLDTNIFPIFRELGAYISDTFQPVLNGIASYLRGPLSTAFGGISKAIQDVIGWIRDMADAINNLQLPDWLTPGSPTPWELGLVGINSAMRDLNQQLPQMARGLDQVGALGASMVGSLAGAGNSSVYNDRIDIFGNVIIQDVLPGGLSERLRARRY